MFFLFSAFFSGTSSNYTLEEKICSVSHVSFLEEARIRIWVQLSTSLVVQLCTSHVLRQNCNHFPPADQHLDTVMRLLIKSSTV